MSDLYIKAVAPSVSRSTATLMKTGQTTSYRTGDDGDIEAGRATSFLVLAENNPFGNTNRFTSEFGTQTYTNNIVIDWSTYNGTTALGYYKLSLGVLSWNNAIDTCLAHSIGGFTSGWRLWNTHEANNVFIKQYANNALEYAPFNLARLQSWFSNTNPTSTTEAVFSDRFLQIQSLAAKTTLLNAFACRTFTVTGTTLS